MAYIKGELRLDEDFLYDARADEEDGQVDGAQAYLPHSCDEWIIGGLKEIDDLIADLNDARAKLAASRPQDTPPTNNSKETL